MDQKLEIVYQNVVDKNPGEKEFHQAVREFLESVEPAIKQIPILTEQHILHRITEPERQIMFKVPWVDDSGQIRVNRGFRVQFNSAIGPYKGGLRFHPSVYLGIIKFLGFEQIFKNSLTGLSMGGAKGGSDFDPKGKSDLEVMRFCQMFMQELYRHIGANTDVPAGDIGVGGREIGYLFGQFKKMSNTFEGVLTGKGLDFGGSLIRPEATGYGATYFAEEMIRRNKKAELKGKLVAISGSGNVAQYAVEKLNELGAKVVTLSDSDGFIYDPNGISGDKFNALLKIKQLERGRIKDYADQFKVDYYKGQRPWSIKCDVALPCATQNEIELVDAQKLIDNGVIAVVEGANMPTTLEATKLLLEHKILFAPGKAANAGGVAVSGLEMTQNSERLSWTREEVDMRLKEIMIGIHRRAYDAAEKYGSPKNYVVGANIAGFLRVANAMIAQGIV